jgi:hypothetical protein
MEECTIIRKREERAIKPTKIEFDEKKKKRKKRIFVCFHNKLFVKKEEEITTQHPNCLLLFSCLVVAGNKRKGKERARARARFHFFSFVRSTKKNEDVFCSSSSNAIARLNSENNNTLFSIEQKKLGLSCCIIDTGEC